MTKKMTKNRLTFKRRDGVRGPSAWGDVGAQLAVLDRISRHIGSLRDRGDLATAEGAANAWMAQAIVLAATPAATAAEAFTKITYLRAHLKRLITPKARTGPRLTAAAMMMAAALAESRRWEISGAGEWPR